MIDINSLLGLGGIDDDDFGYDDMDGLVTNVSPEESFQPIDLDGDGIPDINTYEEFLDAIAAPSDTEYYVQPNDYTTAADPVLDDGNTLIDTQEIDTDGDGIVDSVQYTYGIDSDGDTVIDTIVVDIDFGIDGTIDFSQYGTDTNQDGILDVYGEAFMVDTDNDGILDSMVVSEDSNMDGVFDVSAIIDGSGNISYLDNVVSNQDGLINVDIQPQGPEVSSYNTDGYDVDGVVGNPSEAMQSHHLQETGSSCAVASQEFVLEQITGQNYNESDLREFAEGMSWYSDQGGTPLYDVGNILASQGLMVQKDFGNTIDDIESCLANGGGVIVGVDGAELYDGDDDAFGPGMDADHAVQVIGVDRTDADNPMVILNDPGIPNGAGVMIPMDDFMASWQDSDCFMVEAYANQ